MEMPKERMDAIRVGFAELEQHKQQMIADIKLNGTFERDAAGDFVPVVRQSVRALQRDIADQEAIIQEVQEWGSEYLYIIEEALRSVRCG